MKRPYDVFKNGDEISDNSENSTIRNVFEVNYKGNLPTKLPFKKPRPLTCKNNRVKTFRSSRALISSTLDQDNNEMPTSKADLISENNALE